MSYQSHADIGGLDGYGVVRHDSEDAALHDDWERRVLALTLEMGASGLWNIDSSRAARETLDDYGKLSYFEIWLAALEKLLLQSGALHAEELKQGRMLEGAIPVARVLRAAEVTTALARGSPTLRSPGAAARYSVGQWVRTSSAAPEHHTRLPGYARGKRGVIEHVHGMHVFADTHAQGMGEQPQWLYTVTFDELELWSRRTPQQRSLVSVDAWEPYLVPA
ncbi:MAG: nitrile hydratase subunit beta [Gammaproteobacteria bacterium]